MNYSPLHCAAKPTANYCSWFRNGFRSDRALELKQVMLFLTGTPKRFTSLSRIEMLPSDLRYRDLANCHPKAFQKWKDSGLDLEAFLWHESLECTLIDRGVEHDEYFCYEVRYLNHEEQKCYRFGMHQDKAVVMQQMIHTAFSLVEMGEAKIWREPAQKVDFLSNISDSAIRRDKSKKYFSKK